MTASCIYEGRVVHSRRTPARRSFNYRLFMLYLDLAELAEMRESWFWSHSRPALARFRREDHLGPREQPLDEAVRDLVERELGRRPTGPVRLLTHVRYGGMLFNPISVYYCFDASERLSAAVTEVTNTPWGERWWYVLDVALSSEGFASGSFKKRMHVSPFLPMELAYVWRLGEPNQRLWLSIDCCHRDERMLHAHLDLRRRPLNDATLARALTHHLPIPFIVLGGIYWQALLLKLSGVRFHRRISNGLASSS